LAKSCQNNCPGHGKNTVAYFPGIQVAKRKKRFIVLKTNLCNLNHN
jgi:hypothetical protein